MPVEERQCSFIGPAGIISTGGNSAKVEDSEDIFTLLRVDSIAVIGAVDGSHYPVDH